MKKKNQSPEEIDCPFCKDEPDVAKNKTKKDTDEAIYDFLDKLEKIASFAAAVNQKKAKKAKIRIILDINGYSFV